MPPAFHLLISTHATHTCTKYELGIKQICKRKDEGQAGVIFRRMSKNNILPENLKLGTQKKPQGEAVNQPYCGIGEINQH